MTELKTFNVLMADTHAQYYQVLAADEDQALERVDMWDEDESWALGTWDEGVVDSTHAETNEV
tara:strand:- start:433 stop:621 length:189 start_codon:yes stop_codon:yes gene_type:complete